jgi:hypothetical protein
MAYSYGQLEGLWINAGGSPAMAPIMAAIGLAESGGNPQAENKKDNGGTQTSWGIWQISDGTHNQPVPNILDPEVNAKQAVKKYKSQGLKAWGTYTTGAYKKYLKTGVAPITTGLATGSTSTSNGTDTSVTGDIGDAIGQGFAKAFTSIFAPFMEMLIWGTETLLGGLLMVVGLLMMAAYSKEGESLKGKVKGIALDAVAPEAAPEMEGAEGAAASGLTVPKSTPKPSQGIPREKLQSKWSHDEIVADNAYRKGKRDG